MLIFKRTEQLMKFIITILLLFLAYASQSQTFINRSGAANTVIDQRLGAAQNFYLPRLMDTTLSGGKDSIGNLIYDRLRAKIAIRDTVLTGGHKFTFLFKTDDTTTTLATKYDLSQLTNYNISNAALTADGSYSQNWSENQWFVDSISSLFMFRMGGVGNTGTRRKEFRLIWGGSSFGDGFDAYNMLASIKKADNSGDSLTLGLMSNAGVLSMGTYDLTTPTNNTFISYNYNNGLINIQAKDSIWIKGATPAATADSLLAVVYRSPTASRVVKIPLSAAGGGGATLNNIGAGFRWAATPAGDVKTVAPSNTILWDSTSNANALTAKVDTSEIATQFDLTLINNTRYSITKGTGDSLQFVNDVYIPNKGYAYMAKVGNDTTRGWQELEENFRGYMYSTNSWTSASTGFTNNSVTVDLVNSNLHFTAGSVYGSLALTAPYTNIDNYIFVDTVVINEKSGSSFGSGIGTHSVNTSTGGSNIDIFLRFLANDGGGSGTLALTAGFAHNIVESSDPITFSAGDTLVRVFTRNGFTFTGSVRNITTNGVPEELTYTFDPAGSDVIPNTGQFAIFFLGGEFTINSWKVSSNYSKNARLLLKGDSRFVGYTVTSQPNRLGDLLNASFKSTIVSAGGFDRTTEGLLTLPEDSSFRPQQAIILLGYNDLATGTSLATTEANLDSIYSYYVNHNINPYFLLVATVSPAFSTTTLNAYLRSTYPDNIFDCEQLMTATGALQADGVHWTDYGNQLLYEFIVRAYELYGGNTRYGSSGGFISGTTNYLSMFTGPTSLGNSPMFSDGVGITNTLRYEGANTNPDIVWNDTDAAADEKIWSTETNQGIMNWRTVNDARSAADGFLSFQRTGNVVTLMRFLKLSRFEGGVQLYNTLTGSSSDSILVQELGTGNIKRIAPILGGNTIYTGDGTLAGHRNINANNLNITWSDANVFRINSDYNVISLANGTIAHTESITGSNNMYRFGYTPTIGSYTKGVGIAIDTNNNIGLGVEPITTMPLYATGNSMMVQGLQSLGGNFYNVDDVNTNTTAALDKYWYNIDATSGNITITLPAASAAFGGDMGIQYVFRRVDASGNTVTIIRAGSDTINGATTTLLSSQYEVKEIQCVSTAAWAIK